MTDFRTMYELGLCVNIWEPSKPSFLFHCLSLQKYVNTSRTYAPITRLFQEFGWSKIAHVLNFWSEFERLMSETLFSNSQISNGARCFLGVFVTHTLSFIMRDLFTYIFQDVTTSTTAPSCLACSGLNFHLSVILQKQITTVNTRRRNKCYAINKLVQCCR